MDQRKSPHLSKTPSTSFKFSDTYKEKVLSEVDLFKSFSKEAIGKLAKIFSAVFLKPDEVLFREGDVEETMYIILSGEILIFKLKKTIAVSGPGEYFGEMALIDHKPRSASARALSDTCLLEVKEQQFREYLLSEPEAVVAMLKTLSQRLRYQLNLQTNEMQKINIFTHDMRNCLVPLGISEALLSESIKTMRGKEDAHRPRKGWESMEKSLQTVKKVMSNLTTLIDQSLTIAKNEKSEYVKEKGKLVPLIEETVGELSYHKHVRDKKIEIKYEGEIKECLFNYLDIKRVLQNLILNAGYASPKSGTIEIVVREGVDQTEISVKDHGTGIPDEIKNRLLKESFTSKSDGNGFGLLSCRDIIQEYHEGTIWFESELGKGTSFHFTLPNPT